MLKPETREGWVPRRQRSCATAKTAARANAAVMDTRPRVGTRVMGSTRA